MSAELCSLPEALGKNLCPVLSGCWQNPVLWGCRTEVLAISLLIVGQGLFSARRGYLSPPHSWSSTIKSCNDASSPARTHQVLQRCVKSCKDASSPARTCQVLQRCVKSCKDVSSPAMMHQVLQGCIKSCNNASPATMRQVLQGCIKSCNEASSPCLFCFIFPASFFVTFLIDSSWRDFLPSKGSSD